MFGAKRKNRGVYWCKSNVKKLPGCRCALNTLEHAEIEGHLKTYLHDAGHVVAEFGKKKTSKDEGEKFRADVEKAMWEYFYMAKATEKTEQEAGTLRIITPPWETGSDDVSKSYRKLFDSRQPKLRSELDQLETSHTRLTLAWSDLPTARAKEKARIRLAELEAEMTEIEKQLINHADGWDDALRRVRTLQNDWEKMSTSIASETSGRLKATAVRRIISQIRCKFVPTGLHRPTARLISITFIPKIGTNAVVNTEELPRRRRWLSFS
jgi:hypothetical protein